MQNCNTVRRRALDFLAALNEMGYSKEIPLNEAKDLFSRVLDIWDRASLKAYFGVKAHTTKRLVQRTAIYRSTSTISNKDIYLSEKFETCPGYLEKMGLVSYSLKGKVWFMKIETANLVPQLVKAGCGFINNFSLSPYSVGSSTCGETVESLTCGYTNELETKQQLQKGREKTGSVDLEDGTQSLAYLEQLRKAKTV